ncbi:hypothetical protein D3C81_1457520 [compost metagenome]
MENAHPLRSEYFADAQKQQHPEQGSAVGVHCKLAERQSGNTGEITGKVADSRDKIADGNQKTPIPLEPALCLLQLGGREQKPFAVALNEGKSRF